MDVTRGRGPRLFQVRVIHTKTFAVPTKCRSIYSSVEEVHEVPKSLSAPIVVDSMLASESGDVAVREMDRMGSCAAACTPVFRCGDWLGFAGFSARIRTDIRSGEGRSVADA